VGFFIDCFIAVWNCVGGGSPGGGPKPAPEIDATNGAAAVALLLCVGIILYRQLQPAEH
jgi:hypothetical protein